LESLKKNNWNIPRTISNLSNINHVKHLDTAVDIIKHHKRVGNIFINLNKDNGLYLYRLIPKSFKGKFIGVFKKRPKVILGLTRIHLLIHTIKVFKKHHLIAIIIPIVAMALIQNYLPIYVIWTIFIGASGYALFLMTIKTKTKKRKEKQDAKPNNSNR
jgi:hypothetical protein